MPDFTGRVVVVTGAAKGIGRAIAEGFLKQNAAVVAMLDYDGDGVEKTAKELDPNLDHALPIRCDVSKRDSVDAAMKAIVEKGGRIDILVNNAGITRDGMFHKMTEEAMRAVMEVNFFGTYNCCAAVIQGMRDQEYGRIINISSTSAHGNIGQANYAASKGAVISFTKTLAKESGRKGITCNCIEPGNINTDMLAAIPKEKLEARIQQVPMQRFGEPMELANLVFFLASDEASYMSGSSIICSGASIVH